MLRRHNKQSKLQSKLGRIREEPSTEDVPDVSCNFLKTQVDRRLPQGRTQISEIENLTMGWG
jgi:hypothetical protein